MVKSETCSDPSLKIEARDDEHKNLKRSRKKYLHAITRLSTKASKISRSDKNLPRIYKRPFATPRKIISILTFQHILFVACFVELYKVV